MGCDIHAYVEHRAAAGWGVVDSGWMDVRSYGAFAFLADVRNYSHVPPISQPRGFPDGRTGADYYEGYPYGQYHSTSWLTLAELLGHDYSQVFWDRRVTKKTGECSWDCAALAEAGEGQHRTLREFLGEWFFAEVEKLRQYGEPHDVRVVFWFDN